MVSDMERYLFDLRGYLVVPGVLEAGEVATLNGILDQLGLDDLDDKARETRLEWLPDLGQPFLDLIDDERILPYLLAFVDDYVRLDHSYGIQMVDGTPGLGLHGEPDNRAPNCAWYQVRNGVVSSGLTVVSYALTDVPSDAGGFVCVPGSHKANFPSPFLDQPAAAIREHLAHAELRAGDAVIFTEALTHGSMAWTGPNVRRALFYKYAPGIATWLTYPWAERDLERLTPRQRRMVAPAGVVDGTTTQGRQPITLQH